MKNTTEQYTIRSYIVGFALSLVLSLTAYWLVVNHNISGNSALIIIGILALIQFFVQMLCFLHLGRETKPRWKLIAFTFMVMVVAIIVFGSIWIMTNLNYHHVDPVHSSDTYIIQDERVQR